MAKRKRRAFTDEFKTQTVRVVRESGKSIGAIAQELDLTESAVRAWVRQAGIDAGHGPAGWGLMGASIFLRRSFNARRS